jgi:hypothetical protein
MNKILAITIIISATFSTFLNAQTTFYDRATVQTIEIFFASSSWDAILDAATTTDTYTIADSVRINGVVFDSVGVKYKGNSSYNASNNKNPLHLNLDYIKGSQDYEGYTSVKLQNGYQDPSMIREVLSYAILEQYMDCPKANFANVYINGTLRGVYSNAESINEDFCGDHFYSTYGSFFKCNPIGGAGPTSTVNPDLKWISSDSSAYFNGYELISDFGWNDLVNLINVLNNDFTQIETVLDVDRALWMLAFNNVLVNLDSYSGAFRQNYYLYKDQNGRFDPVIWDLNMSFAGFPGGTGSGSYTATSLDPMSNSTSTNHPLIKKMLADPMYKRMYMAHLRTIVQEIFASGDYITTANTIRTTIDASVQADPYKFYTYTQYQNSLTTSVTGSGPGGGTSIPGIQQLMDARVTYFNTNSNYTLVAPTITSFAASTNTPYYGQNITMTVTASNETSVYFGYRFNVQDRFTRLAMYDDGAHNDGVAGDHVYGVSVTLNCGQMQYYFYVENNDAGLFSPQRAEHEYYTLSVVMPWPTQGQIVINEVMADNGTIVLDNYNENDDWIELYNTTSSAIALSGMYLSDDPLLLNEWQFPTGSYIAPNSYLIVWADKDADQSGLHTNFKLSSAGESVIFGNGAAAFDQVDFTAQTTDVSFARCPDAGVFDLTAPTFGVTNNCFAGIADDTARDVRIYPVPTSDKLTIVSEVNYQFRIVDLLGRSIASGELSLGDTVLDLSSSTSGIYEVIFTDAKGNRWSMPIIKN